MSYQFILLSLSSEIFPWKSRVTVSYVYMSYQFVLLSLSSEIFPWKSRVTVSCNGKLTVLILYHRCYLYSVWISGALSALFCCSGQLRPLAGNRLQPQPPPTSGGGCVPGLCSCYVSIYVNVSMYTRSAANVTIRVKIRCPTDWAVSCNLWSNAAWMLSPPRTVGRVADCVASSHSAPIRVEYCLFSESGLFWAI